MNWRKIGIHKFKDEKSEIAHGVVDSFCGCNVMRVIQKCKCGKKKRIVPLNIAASKACFDENLDWR
jgi:hypothetical protein